MHVFVQLNGIESHPHGMNWCVQSDCAMASEQFFIIQRASIVLSICIGLCCFSPCIFPVILYCVCFCESQCNRRIWVVLFLECLRIKLRESNSLVRIVMRTVLVNAWRRICIYRIVRSMTFNSIRFRMDSMSRDCILNIAVFPHVEGTIVVFRPWGACMAVKMESRSMGIMETLRNATFLRRISLPITVTRKTTRICNLG